MDRAAVSVVSKIGQVLVEELQDIRGVGNKVIQLRDELATMNAVLRVISEAEEGSVDHIVREWEKQVHDLVYDAEDCTDTYSLCISRPMARPSIYARAKRVAMYPYKKLVLQRALAADIKDLLVRTTAVSERRARYNIDRATLPRAAFLAPVSAASISASALRRADDHHQFVGITEQGNVLVRKIKAVKVLVHDQLGKIKASVQDEDDEIKAAVHDNDDKIKAAVHDEDDKSLKIFSIVGFGGLGKTALAMEVCRQLEADFPCQALVSVSQAFDAGKDMKGLLVRVLQQILKEEESKIDKMNVEELSSKIKELLDHKRYLIVIDDVWNLSALEAILIRLPKTNHGSRIIVTTRMEVVAKAASVYFVHHMKPLEPKAGKELFLRRVFGSREGTCPAELEDTMDTILKKCGGMPLAIVSIASLLASYRLPEGTDMWKRVSKSIGSRMVSHPNLEGMRQLITLSYDYLPHHLKACMMYLSIFPEDYVIAKERLLYKWIAEGLVTEQQGLTLLEVAEEYLNELISRNMIQPDKFVFQGYHFTEVELEGCRVHDMILEIMVSKSEESNFVSLVGRQYGRIPQGKVRRLSIHDNDHGTQKVEAMKLQHVRSLTTFQLDGLDKLLDRLGEFKLLRVLDLEDCKDMQDKHMREVCRLYLLRFLSLRGTHVRVMPREVGNLEEVETLDVKNTRIMELPRTVTKLRKLERLRCNYWHLPRGLGNMKALCEVDMGLLRGDDAPLVAQEIGQLPRLKALRIGIDNTYGTESLHELASSLSNTSTLRSLILECRKGSRNCLEFLLGVSTPPPLLQCLGVYGSISQLPDWISSLTHLTKFEVGSTELAGEQLFDVLCKLPNLQSIQLSENSYKGPELVAQEDHSFPMLRILIVSDCPTVVTFKKRSMTKLETLVLGFVNEAMSIVGVENLKSLKQVKLRGKEGNMAMERAVLQLKPRSTESNQIKIVADWY